ncbi:vWA domain-containing protein [Kibdelosporangium aridum]|uniref:Predicted metal-dependent peptidase n=1 Tax=Kibdelosporangium aridum TaxID=2030 RepID=A0A1W2CFD8_KIBAR|nr:VWA-like domain-containing protein [Kibdelosporangium aridum]SMC83957.1 Predicted metal-dependent peptidase [Kibdelosporangium aridum]
MVELDRTKLLAARYKAATQRPYLAAAMYALSIVPSVQVPTMGVDKYWRCYVSPAFVARTPVDQLAGVWMHEVAHLLRDHHGRAAKLPINDHHRINLAQDCEINDDLIADGIALPEFRVVPSDFDQPNGKLFEQYLPHVPRTPMSHDCGSGAHGHAVPWETQDGNGVSPVEAEAIRRQTAEAMRAHARAQGKLPAGWKLWADQLLEPVVDWRVVLAGAVREAVAWASGAMDYTYRRPSRRAAAMPGVVLPGLRRPLPRVAIVIDTSGSMGEAELNTALSEVTGVLREVGIRGNRVTVLACDADVHTVARVTKAADIELAGGGGTDMRVGIQAALSAPDRPQVIIVLTDGYTPWPEEIPSCRVIAGLVGQEQREPPAWIEAVHIR